MANTLAEHNCLSLFCFWVRFIRCWEGGGGEERLQQTTHGDFFPKSTILQQQKRLFHESHGSGCTVSVHTISGSHDAGSRFTWFTFFLVIVFDAICSGAIVFDTILFGVSRRFRNVLKQFSKLFQTYFETVSGRRRFTCIEMFFGKDPCFHTNPPRPLASSM